jgi:hypothetical protein
VLAHIHEVDSGVPRIPRLLLLRVTRAGFNETVSLDRNAVGRKDTRVRYELKILLMVQIRRLTTAGMRKRFNLLPE